MEADNNTPELRRAAAAQRVRASGPILILAVLFVVGAFLTWYFTWFGRNLSDADISQYLVDEKHPRRVQHALLQIQHRIESGGGAVSLMIHDNDNSNSTRVIIARARPRVRAFFR